MMTVQQSFKIIMVPFIILREYLLGLRSIPAASTETLTYASSDLPDYAKILKIFE